eukprot:4772479-Heterocapsa_arctica.AAC.1
MERGVHTGKDRAYSTFPCHTTVSEKESGQARSGQVDEGGGKEYHHDEEEGPEFICDCGGTE